MEFKTHRMQKCGKRTGECEDRKWAITNMLINNRKNIFKAQCMGWATTMAPRGRDFIGRGMAKMEIEKKLVYIGICIVRVVPDSLEVRMPTLQPWTSARSLAL